MKCMVYNAIIIQIMTISPVPLFIVTAADLVTGRGVFCGLVKPAQSRSDTLRDGGEEQHE